MASSAPTHHPLPPAPAAPVGSLTHAARTTRIAPATLPPSPAPTLEKAIFKLTAALTYEDFADAVETFCHATVPHDSHLIGIGHADYRNGDYTSLVDHLWNIQLPGARLVDPGLRAHLLRADQEHLCNTPGTLVWHDKNDLPRIDLNDSDFLKTELYRRIIEPERWVSNLCVPLWIDDNIHTLFWLKRAEGQPPFSDAETRLMEHYHPWLLATLKRVCQLEENRAHKNDITHALFDIPVPTFLIDWNLRVIQRNAAAGDACAAWRHGPKAARATKPPFLSVVQVPAEILAACGEMKNRWSAHCLDDVTPLPGAYARAVTEVPGFKQRVKIPHPANPRMEATITMLRPSALRQAHPSFLVRINETTLDTNATAAADTTHATTTEAARRDRRTRLLAQLTQAERALVPHIARGLSDKEIARALCKSVPTVKNQLRSIYEKLRVPNRARLIAALR